MPAGAFLYVASELSALMVLFCVYRSFEAGNHEVDSVRFRIGEVVSETFA